MKRNVIWSLLLAALLATLTALWFLDTFEQVPTQRWEAAQKEALRNPYLALERLFARLGRPVTRLASPHSLDALPAGGVLILDENRRRIVDPARAERLLSWVQEGGYLIVAAEQHGDDPLLSRLGLTHARQHPSDEAPSTAPAKPRTPTPIELALPGSETRYRLEYAGHGLSSSVPAPAWQAGPDDGRSALLHYSWGRGQISVFDDLQFLGNQRLGKFDHAELIWALLQHYQPQGELRLASRLEVPTLWQWLLESAAMLLISAAVLITLWLWRIIPRFGGTCATPSAERRDLLQHLAAIGRSVWREGGIAHWLNVVRQALHQRLALRHPYLLRQDASAQRIALAKIAACTTKDIQSALTSAQTPTPDQFTTAMQTLQRLDQRL